VEVNGSASRTSLLQYGINYNRKEFYNTNTGRKKITGKGLNIIF